MAPAAPSVWPIALLLAIIVISSGWDFRGQYWALTPFGGVGLLLVLLLLLASGGSIRFLIAVFSAMSPSGVLVAWALM